MKASVYVSLGSNIDPHRHITEAIGAMRRTFGDMRLSPVYRSAAVGFDGDDFLNLVAGFETAEPVEKIVGELHRIEDDLGRDRSQPRFSSRAIDLDILLYDFLVVNRPGIRIPRQEILRSAHVLKPLQDLIADTLHPLTGQSYGELWRDLAPRAPRLEVVELETGVIDSPESSSAN